MGETTQLSGGDTCVAFFTSPSGDASCAQHAAGLVRGDVLGTYLHGFFDAPGVVEALVNALLARRGLPSASFSVEPASVHRERELDRLAAALRASLDISAVRRILEESV